MDNNLRPIAYKYNENIEQYFKDLDHWYRYFGRPKDWKICDQKQLIFRSIAGKFKV